MIHAGPPEFAGLRPAGATRLAKRFWAEIMGGGALCLRDLVVIFLEAYEDPVAEIFAEKQEVGE